MKHKTIPVSLLSRKQRTNLKKLLKFIEENKKAISRHLSMDTYFEKDGKEVDPDNACAKISELTECGASCCLIGFAAVAKIGSPQNYHSWESYYKHAFGDGISPVWGDDIYDFIFSGGWKNNLKLGILRIKFALKYGIPDSHADYRDAIKEAEKLS